MCLITFAWKQHAKYKLILVANRDEFYQRKTTVARYWEEDGNVLGGKDLQAGGTWMGINRNGKWAAVTNFRDLRNIKEEAPSRGALPKNYLTGSLAPVEYLQNIRKEAKQYNGFNLLIGNQDTIWIFSNQTMHYSELKPGIYGLSNHLLDTPWPKVVRSKEFLAQAIENDQLQPDHLLEGFYHTEKADEQFLPDTGAGLALERALSPIFIMMGHYGTRSTSILMIDNQNQVYFRERSYKPENDQVYNFTIQ